MRFAVVLVVAIACSVAFASEPGQPLDCNDWLAGSPEYVCTSWARPCPTGDCGAPFPNTATVDASGAVIYVRQTESLCSDTCGNQRRRGFEIRRFDGSIDAPVGSIEGRCNDGTAVEQVTDVGLLFDGANGRLLVHVVDYCQPCQQTGFCSPYGGSDYRWVAAIGGFTTTFDVLQTYTPPSALGFRVPYMPEGLPAADRFDTYWGPLSHPIDFSQAHPLQCAYPSPAPHAGDYLTVNDPLRDPDPGTGYYYVTAATYQGQTRYGRKTTAGHLSGRDPSLLPACAR
jgi:hypothetical protein